MISFETFYSSLEEARHAFDYPEWGIIDVETGKLYNGKEYPESIWIDPKSKQLRQRTHMSFLENLGFQIGDVIEYLTPLHEPDTLLLRFRRGKPIDPKIVYNALAKNRRTLPLMNYYTFDWMVGLQTEVIRTEDFDILLAEFQRLLLNKN